MPARAYSFSCFLREKVPRSCEVDEGWTCIPLPLATWTRMKIYLDYDQAELDRAYTQSAWAPNAEEIIRWYGPKSADVRGRLKHQANIAYGETQAEVLDLFPTDRTKAPICVFVHGGAWTLLTNDQSAFAAEVFVEAGVHFVAINFAVVPQVRLPEMVAQVRRATAFVHRHA